MFQENVWEATWDNLERWKQRMKAGTTSTITHLKKKYQLKMKDHFNDTLPE